MPGREMQAGATWLAEEDPYDGSRRDVMGWEGRSTKGGPAGSRHTGRCARVIPRGTPEKVAKQIESESESERAGRACSWRAHSMKNQGEVSNEVSGRESHPSDSTASVSPCRSLAVEASEDWKTELSSATSARFSTSGSPNQQQELGYLLVFPVLPRADSEWSGFVHRLAVDDVEVRHAPAREALNPRRAPETAPGTNRLRAHAFSRRPMLVIVSEPRSSLLYCHLQLAPVYIYSLLTLLFQPPMLILLCR
ncbi:hypothetical protein B0H19DRAFT_1228170 [Mycena capillaripes]|nr:hypothetical protein B0H19DRAFT_1228170 [Mycena capillaripes]